MSKPTAFMPLWIDDFLGGTMDFDAELAGAYLLLLMAYWKNQGPLPVDDFTLQHIARIRPDRWPTVKARLVAKFELTVEGWRHERCEIELAKAKARYEKRCNQTAKATEARRRKRNGERNGERNEATSQPTQPTTHNPPCTPHQPQPTTPTTKLPQSAVELAQRGEILLGDEWINDAGKWVNRIKAKPKLVERVFSELGRALTEGDSLTTSAGYVEDLWKRWEQKRDLIMDH